DAVPHRSDGVLSIGQQWLDVAIGRDAPVLTVDVAVTGAFGAPAEHRFLVALTPQARTADVTGIPVLRRKVAQVLDHLGANRNSYSGQRAMDVLATYPR